MKVIDPEYRITTHGGAVFGMKLIEKVGRTCYKSEDKITDDSYINFIKRLVARKHEAILEHCSATVTLRVDRGVSHELVRHRIASYAQESTRYCNYKNQDIEFVRPSSVTGQGYDAWLLAMSLAETAYKSMQDEGCTPQQARAVLPNSLATTINITANMREWRTIFKLRCAKDAHPDMRYVMLKVLDNMHCLYPPVFEDLHEQYKPDIRALNFGEEVHD